MESNCQQKNNNILFANCDSPKADMERFSHEGIFFSLKDQFNLAKQSNQNFGEILDEISQTEHNNSESQRSQNKEKLTPALKKSISSSKLKNHPQKNSKSKLINYIQKSLKMRQFICGICEEEYLSNQKISIGGCDHYFCESCIQSYIIIKVDSFEKVQCPETNCEETLHTDSLLFKSLPAKIQKKFTKHHHFLETVKNPSLRLCSNENCEDGVIKIPQNWLAKPQNYEGISVSCNKCKNKYCLQCFELEHSGECQKRDEYFFGKCNRYRQCLKCKNLIQKGEGCNQMTCRCGYKFCYLCGAEWEVKGHFCSYIEQQAKRRKEQQKKRQIQQSRCTNLCMGLMKIIFKILFFIPLYSLALCLLLPKTLIKIIIFSIGSVLSGITFYTCSFIWKRQNKKISLVLVFLYPFVIFVGISIAFINLFSMFVVEDLQDLKKLTEIMLFW